MTLIDALKPVLGNAHVLTGSDTSPYTRDWTEKYPSAPLAVVRPATTAQVAQVVKLARAHNTAIVPLGGNTGLTGGGQARGELMLSLERLNAIRAVKPEARLAIVEAGVILQDLHTALQDHNLIFPLTFGARGSARIGGCLSTNAGGSNVVRYGSTRGLCLGLEVVLANGEILDLMSELHKDNSGYDLRDLFIGAEGTLGIITAAVLKLSPKPDHYATAQIAVPDLATALQVLHRLQSASGGAVEAFEYMPRPYMERLARFRPDLRAPFDQVYETSVMVELGGIGGDMTSVLETELGDLLDSGQVLDAVIAQNDAQRAAIWESREAAAEITFNQLPMVNADVCLPLDRIQEFFDVVRPRIEALEPGLEDLTVAHLGDGNLHFTVYPTHDDPAHVQSIQDAIDAVTVALGGSVSAEHGVGQSKLSTLRAHKDPVALRVMAAVKSALDPDDILNPGKVNP